MNTDPSRLAPAPSNDRSGVNDRPTPIVVAITISQKKPLVRLICSTKGADSPSCCIAGTMRSLMKCEMPVTPNAIARITIDSQGFGMRITRAWYSATLSRSVSTEVVSAPFQSSIFFERPAANSSTAIQMLATMTSTVMQAL